MTFRFLTASELSVRSRLKYSIWKVISVLSFALGLLGCVAVSPTGQMGDGNSPGVWAASKEAQAGIDRAWVKKMGGRELEGLLESALANNEDIKVAAARLDRATAEAKIAGANRLPSLGLDFNGQRNKQNFIGFPFGGGGTLSNTIEQFGVSLGAAWELDVWGRAKAGKEAELANQQAREYEVKAARVSLAAQVTKAWLALAEANEQIILAESAVKSAGILADAVRERYERAIVSAGGTAAQVQLTEVERSTRQAALAQRKQERERVLRQLEILLGNYPSGSLVAAAQLPKFPGATPAGLPSELLQRRPDVLAAERELAASGRRLKMRKLARFPSISLTANTGTNSGSIRDILSSDALVWGLGGGLTQPIFQAGRIGNEIEAAQATQREQGAMLRKVVLKAFSEVEQALIAETYLAEREAAVQQAARIAAEAAERSNQEYSSGIGDVMTLIEATQRKIDSASQFALIRHLRLENRVNLHLALGGDFRATRK